MIEDDPKTPEPAQDAPAGEQQDRAPQKPEGDEPKGEAEQTLLEDEEALDLTDDEDEDDEAADDEQQEGDEPKRKEPSRGQRYKRQIDALKAENEALRGRASGIPANEAAIITQIEARVRAEIGDPPRQEQFKDADGNIDFISFHNEQQAWLNDRRAVTREVKRDMVKAIEAAQAHVATLVDAHKERVAKFRTKVKDWDQVMAGATLPVEPHVERLLIQSKKSAQLSYVLGKNQGKLAQLNRMDAESAARELGRLEARLSLPPPKQQTQARKPVKPLRGGGAAPQSQLAQVNALMKKWYGDRA
jgi:Bacteriophage, scaffolding protein